MDCGFEFPLYVCLDDGEVIRIEDSDKILYHLEAIDIENNEYQFWDATGCPLRLVITKDRVSGLRSAENKVTLPQAIQQYSKRLGLTIDTGGKPGEIWAKLDSAKESPSRTPSLFSRLFSNRKT